MPSISLLGSFIIRLGARKKGGVGRPLSLNRPVGLETDRSYEYERPRRPVGP